MRLMYALIGMNDYVKENYGVWTELVSKEYTHTIDWCRKYHVLLKHVSKTAIKSTARLTTEFGAKTAVRTAAKNVTKLVSAGHERITSSGHSSRHGSNWI